MASDPETAATFYYWLGDVYCFELDNTKKAIETWEIAIKSNTLGPEEARLRFALCEAYIDTGRFEEAQSVLDQNCDDEEQYICRSHFLFRGLACSRISKLTSARTWFLEGLQHALHRIEGLDDPNDNYGYQMLGKALLFLGLEEEARQAFQYRIYKNTLQDPGGALHRAFCDVCYDSGGIRGVRYVCKSCYDIDLCEVHHELWLKKELNLARCKFDHSYLSISPTDATEDAGMSQSTRDWITAIRARLNLASNLSNVALEKASNAALPEVKSNIQPFWRRRRTWIGVFQAVLLFLLYPYLWRAWE